MKVTKLILSSLCCCLLASCALQHLESESGLYNVKLSHSYKAAVDGFWTWGKGNPFAHQKSGTIYIAPLNVAAVKKSHPELAAAMVPQMHDLMSRKMLKALSEGNAANHSSWRLTSDPAGADIRINLAVVSLRQQKPAVGVGAKVLGVVAPFGVGTAVGLLAKGDITIEGTIRNGHSGQLLMAFKDSNRAPLRIYHKDTYTRSGNVDANLRVWAEKMAKLFRECSPDRLGDHTLREKIEHRGAGDIITTRVGDAL